MLVDLREVSKVYRRGKQEVRALDGISLRIEPGEFVAIMGASGSGKSTLLHLVGGLDLPTSGEVRLGDVATAALSDDKLTLLRRRQIGFIFQFFNLLPTLTAAENVALPLLIDGQSLSRVRPRVDELLELVGLSDRRDHKPDELSGGQMQRVAIARALVSGAPLLLADEPTGNLDSRLGEEVLRLLQATQERYGHTIVMVTHDPRAASYGDRVVTLSDGQIVGDERGGATTGEGHVAVVPHH